MFLFLFCFGMKKREKSKETTFLELGILTAEMRWQQILTQVPVLTTVCRLACGSLLVNLNFLIIWR